MKKVLSIVLAVTMLLSCWAITGTTAMAATSKYKISMYGTYDQTEARKILNLVNDMRTSSTDSWYWNANGTKYQCKTHNKLKYDYALEKLAMQRAAEIAIRYNHVRPDDTAWYTIYDKGQVGENYKQLVIGENIAAGYMDSSSVNMGWREDEEPYEMQGHRRNMLNESFKAIGVGHVVFNGIHYWVELFSDTVNSTTATTANNKSTKMSMTIASSIIQSKKADTQSKVTVEAMEAKALPATVKLKITTMEYWNDDMTVYVAPGSFTSANTSIAKIDNGKVRGVAQGSTTLNTTAMGVSVKVPVTVTKSHTYTKKVIAPTYVAQGYTQFTCSDCGKVYKDYYTAKKKLPTPTKLTLTAKSKAMKVTYKKVSAASGYQIKYSKSSSFSSSTTAKVSGASTVSKTIKSLKSGKKYYVKVRSYKVQNGKTAYSSWSSAKSVVVK